MSLCNLRSVLCIAVALSAPAAQASLLQNGDFSQTYEYSPGDIPNFNPLMPSHWDVAPFSEDGQLAGGDLSQNFSIVADSGAYGSIDGGAGLVLAMYNVSSVQQTFTVTQTGLYSISWLDAAPETSNDYNQTYFASGPEARGLHYAMTLDGNTIAEVQTGVGQDFTSRSFSLSLDPGVYTLGFAGLDHGELITFGGSNQYGAQSVTYIALLDNVSIVAVPEPETYALMLAGLGVLAAMHRRKPRKGREQT
ncbi:PEP-CTERM sorting domain-containing protein [Schlegelella sp. S2-27]|uniref:PEP-CTERM sorting domain-containing protein n=1 Tax=Caldimonas mangrovi TaxID=2944811 RepID=A0ABT0YLH6_9BURK|nr:PEP-CTERM sorting domain-containing protein [Caldimonas mangrovi]MCM5679581.1 PEP-CTERM sorting domain-containing protein [Caldimonas mangrovi]